MAFKRIIGTIFVKERIVVKSYGFSNWRPNGNIKSTLKNLDYMRAYNTQDRSLSR